jgi:hypothetical protein
MSERGIYYSNLKILRLPLPEWGINEEKKGRRGEKEKGRGGCSLLDEDLISPYV